MVTASKGNFAGELAGRLGRHSHLIDAASGLTIEPEQVPRLVAGYGAVFRKAGLTPGERVLVASPLSPLSCLAYLGVMYAGLVAVPVEERLLATSGAKLVEATGANAIWTEQPAAFEWLRQMPQLICLHGDLAGGSPEPMAPVARQDSDLAALMATSGSTGVPRFVMVTHGNLRANTEAIARSQGLQDNERAMLVLPISYCFGASVVHTHLWHGGGVVFDRRFMFPDKVVQAMAKHQCTTFAGVPTAYNVLVERSKIKQTALPSLRRMLQAGGALARPVIEEIRRAVPRIQFYVMYGQTEATARITCLEPSRLDDKAGSAGRPLDNLTVRILNEQGGELPQGQTGEIWVKGPSVCAGYLNDTAENESVFRDGWLRTRDLGRLDEEGFLWVQGRLGAFAKMRGMRVSFAEVEAKVASLPGVMECAAHAVPHPEAGEALVLLIVPRTGAQPVWEEMRRGLPAHWMFDSARFVGELPKTANGKLSRAALAQQLNASHGPA
jgi:acyl-CoA synthetase (AMP-forming)/AMP-acid ligase II